MRAVRARGQEIEVVEVPLPVPGEERVLVRMLSAGICGSDLTMLPLGFLRHTIGHEFAGELDDGTPVSVQPTTPCGACELCARGDYQLCRACIDSTLGVYRDGGMADCALVDRAGLVPLPAELPAADACLVEPLAVALHGLGRVGLQAGQRVAVVGAGSIGLLAAAAARARGCSADIAGRHVAQLRAAEALGVGRAPDADYDLVIDAAGSERAIARAVELARPGGSLLLLGWDWERIVLPGAALAEKELLVCATMTYGHQSAVRDVDLAAALLADHAEIASAVITHRFPLDEAERAFATAADRKAGAIKVVLEP